LAGGVEVVAVVVVVSWNGGMFSVEPGGVMPIAVKAAKGLYFDHEVRA
jgi:hypothetical protein